MKVEKFCDQIGLSSVRILSNKIIGECFRIDIDLNSLENERVRGVFKIPLFGKEIEIESIKGVKTSDCMSIKDAFDFGHFDPIIFKSVDEIDFDQIIPEPLLNTIGPYILVSCNWNDSDIENPYIDQINNFTHINLSFLLKVNRSRINFIILINFN